MKKNNTIKHDNYFKEYIRHGYFIVSLFLAVLTITFLVALVQFDVLDAIESVKNLTLYLAISIGIIVLLVLIYMIAKIRCSRLSIADSLGFAFILTGIGSVIYFALLPDHITQTDIIRIIICGLIFVIGLAYLFFRLAFFTKHERRKIIYIKNSLTGYFSLIGQKYSFMSVLLTGIVITAVVHLGLLSSFAGFVVSTFLNNLPFAVIMGFAATVFILYVAIQVSDKHVNSVDVILSSGVIIFPISALNCILLKDPFTTPLTLLAIIFALYLVLFIVRINCFDITVPEKHDKKHFTDALLSVATSALLVGGSVLLIKADALQNSFAHLGEMDTVHCVSFFPVLVIALAIAISTLFNVIVSIANINAKKLNGADILTDISFITSIMAFSLLLFIPSYVLGIGLGAFFIMNLTIFIARRRTLSVKRRLTDK